MAAKKAAPKVPQRATAIPADARNKVRVYADLDLQAAIDLEILAARRRLTKKALLEALINESVRAKGA